MKGCAAGSRLRNLPPARPGALGDLALEIADATASQDGGLRGISREALAKAILRTRLVEVALHGRAAVKRTKKGFA